MRGTHSRRYVYLRGLWRAALAVLFLVGLPLLSVPTRVSITPWKTRPLPDLEMIQKERPTAGPALVRGYGQLPMTFEKNLGQTDDSVAFLARGRGYTLFLTPEEAVLSLRRGTGERHVGREPREAPGHDRREDQPVAREPVLDRVAVAALHVGEEAQGIPGEPREDAEPRPPLRTGEGCGHGAEAGQDHDANHSAPPHLPRPVIVP